MNLANFSKNIFFNEEGIWQTNQNESISYTKDGHQLIEANEATSFWFQHRKECLELIINRFKIDQILDIGGGNGVFSLFLQEKNLHPILIEPGDFGVINAKRKGVKNIIHGSLATAEFKKESFPAACMLDVLEHIENEKKFIQEVYRILKGEGILILTVPAYKFLFSEFDEEVGHFRRYTLAKLKRLLTKEGFKIEYTTYLFYPLIFPVIFTRFLTNKFIQKDKRKSQGHIRKNSMLGKVLHYLLAPEKVLIKNKLKIPFGTSCLIVAKK